MSTRLIARTVLSIVGTVSMVLAVGLPYRSTSAAATWVEVRAPFNGYWDRWGWSPPSTHNAYGADWATDYYQAPNANGYWYPVSSGGDSVSTRVSNIYNNCGGASWTYAGISYNFEVTNGSGTLGYFQWAHVYPTGSGFSWWASVPFGTFIGYTYRWGKVTGCWDVDNDNGVHWHIAGYNNSGFSCYAPNSTGAALTAWSSLLGAVGANATGYGQPCW